LGEVIVNGFGAVGLLISNPDSNVIVQLRSIKQNRDRSGIEINGGSLNFTGDVTCIANTGYPCVWGNGSYTTNLTFTGNIVSYMDYGVLFGDSNSSITLRGDVSSIGNSAFHCSAGSCTYLGGHLVSDQLYGLEHSGGTVYVKNAIIESRDADAPAGYGLGDAISKYGGEQLTIEDSTLIAASPTSYSIGSQGGTRPIPIGASLIGTVYVNRIIQSTVPVQGEPVLLSYWPDTIAPEAPNHLSPLDGSTSTLVPPLFTWNTVSDPSWSIKYSIQIDDGADFSSPVISISGLTNGAYVPETELSDGTYYWRLRATDGAGNIGNWSTPWSFVIQSTSGPMSITVNDQILPSYTLSARGSFSINTTTTAANGIDKVSISVNGIVKKRCDPKKNTPGTLDCSVTQQVNKLVIGPNTIDIVARDSTGQTKTKQVIVGGE
jgi:hypothetical protein